MEVCTKNDAAKNRSKKYLINTASTTIFALGEKCPKNYENIVCNLLIGLFHFLKKS